MFFFILKMVNCLFSLESPRWGDSNENTQKTFMLKYREDISIMPPHLALWLTLISSNYPWLEHIFIVLKVFEPLKFYCSYKIALSWKCIHLPLQVDFAFLWMLSCIDTCAYPCVLHLLQRKPTHASSCPYPLPTNPSKRQKKKKKKKKLFEKSLISFRSISFPLTSLSY